jgi:hypothetical protein
MQILRCKHLHFAIFDYRVRLSFFDTVSVTDLDQGSMMIVFESVLKKASFSEETREVTKISLNLKKPPRTYFACPNL